MSILLEDFLFISCADLPFNQLKNKTILISGASGFIASYLVKCLLFMNKYLRLNIKIIGIVKDREKAIKILGKHKNLSLVIQDICNPIKVKGKVDIIIHAASIASPKYFKERPIDTLGANIFGTYNLLKLAGEKKVETFLFFSSGGVYGETKGKTTEKDYGYLDPLDSRSCYHESKRMGETMCMAWASEKKTPIRIIRPFHVYGPGMSLTDGRAIADFITNILRGEDIIMRSDGSSVRSFCYIADFTLGLLTVLLKGKNNEAYNITNDKSRKSILDLAVMLAKLFPNPKVIYVERENGDNYLISRVKDNNPNVDKLRTLGWKPYFNLKQGFRRTIKYFKSS